MSRIVFFLAAALALAGCDSLEVSEFRSEVVVEAYLEAGAPMGSVRLFRTVPVESRFDADSLGVRNADVRIELLRADGSVEETYQLPPVPDRVGLYQSTSSPVVQPLRTYRLVVDVPDISDPITSVTTVPDTFRVTSVNKDTVQYRSDDPLIFFVSRPKTVDRQNVFVITTVALDARISTLTPFAMAQYEDGNETITKLRENLSPPLNEENFDVVNESSIRIRYPWLGLNFYGPNRVDLRAIDRNLFDFIRSQPVQGGETSQPPGEIPNVLEHIDGGRGLFGSYSSVSVDVFVRRDGQF